MDMKEKQPITPTTPVPVTSTTIEAEANRKGPSTTQEPTELEKGARLVWASVRGRL